MRKVLFITTLITFMLTSSTWAADISGKWTLTMWGAGAEESVPVVFKTDGENLTVTCSHPAFKAMTGTGTLKGDEISFNLKSSAMEIGFSGKVTGNKMEGVREVKGAPGGGPGVAQGAPQGMPAQGAPQAQSSENWTAVKN